MKNIDKEKINYSINDAYNNQTEKVKELLESAKKTLVDQKECPYDYAVNKQKAKQILESIRKDNKKEIFFGHADLF